MKTERTDIMRITWEKNGGFGLFEASIINGKIDDVRLLRHGSDPDSEGFHCSGAEGDSTERFITEVHRALGQLLDYLKNKKK